MNDAPAPLPVAPPRRSGRTDRRNRGRRPWGRQLAWTLGALVVVAMVALFSLQLWVGRYLKSEGFAAQLNAAAGHTLSADCRIHGLSWQDPAAYAGTFTASGRDPAAFRSLVFSDLRAEVDTGAIWDRVWRVRHVNIAQMTADFTPGGRTPGPAAAPEAPAPSPPGWLQDWMPNRTEVGPVRVDRFDFISKATLDTAGLEGRGFALMLKPDFKPASMEVEARSGEVRMAGDPRPLQVDRMRATLRPDGAALDQFEGTLEEATVSAEGTITFQHPGALQLLVRLNGASLDRWLPEDWLKRCSGRASAKATLRGDWRQPEAIRAEGEFQVKDAVLQALPLLDIIAKKTQNASFLRIQIKDAAGKFERSRAEHWQLRQLRADAPGLLRMKGGVDVGPGGALRGALLLGMVPGTLRYLAGAEQTVFLTADRFTAGLGHAGSLGPDDAGLLWTTFTLGGTLDQPEEDLSERLARAWFNATVDEVTALSMETAATAARTAAGAANAVLEAAPPLLDKAPELLEQGVQGGLKLLDGLLPR